MKFGVVAHKKLLKTTELREERPEKVLLDLGQ
jgi:hypothetical protein